MLTDLFEVSRLVKSRIDPAQILNAGRVSGLFSGAKAVFMAVLSESFKKTLILAPTGQEAEKLFGDLKYFLDEKNCGLFLLDLKEAESRLPALKALSGSGKTVVVSSIGASKAVTFSPGQLDRSKIVLKEGMSLRIERLIEDLIRSGFVRQSMVEASGELAVRGGIVDIFPVIQAPVRIEYDGDKIASIRHFEALTQRSTQKIEQTEILPAKETGTSSIFDYFSKGDAVFIDEPQAFKKEDLGRIKSAQVIFNALPRQDGFIMEAQTPQNYALRSEDLISDLKKQSGRVYIVTGQDERLAELLDESGVQDPEVKLVRGQLSQGFMLPDLGLAVFTDREIFGEKFVQRRFKEPKEEIPLRGATVDFKEGDFVVHKDHGIGLYKGIVSQTFNGRTCDYLFIQYRGQDRLYVPVDKIQKVLAYRAASEHAPDLNSLGGHEWHTAKKKAKASAKKLTQDLLDLYSSRNSRTGFSYPPDNVWQHEFESAFPFDETPDQALSIRAVKNDMESQRPMDRLLCGDVGFGKTEVALRAAFKAVCSGKQAALLVPTTVLAEQHFQTFKSRFAPFPFRVEMLSRFRTKEQQKATVSGLEEGTVDVVIGTHRLLSKDVKFKDLGLLIVDEEHKFGVGDKEKLKAMKKGIDCLSMSATPIPRTLYMALSDLWNISVIETPPPGRSSINTSLLPWSQKALRDAVVREIDRGGQVFYIHNRIHSIRSESERLREAVPEARIALAHGRMKGHELERIMLDFIEKKYDVLVSTAIVESGIDIPSVNTILINDPARFGLSTLYQLRGRAGRSDVKAYCYLLYSDPSGLSGPALERLSAIKSFTELGSGYKIAMRDLEIRGAGEVLGARQSGHIATVGFDLFCEMLKEAADRARGIKPHKEREVKIELPVDSYLPAFYVEGENERISYYRRLNTVSSDEGIKDIREELLDRFGKLPRQAENLFEMMGVRITALKKEVRSVTYKNGSLVIERASSKDIIRVENEGEAAIIRLAEKSL
ncbi:MAG: transcription-repair coupling factor [Candidatus Margulisiibacteriota bacterium]